MEKRRIIIDGQETNYFACDDGTIYNGSTNRFLKGTTGRIEGAVSVQLTIDKKPKCFLVHQLIAQAFVPKPNEELTNVTHLDGNYLNNRPENLRWVLNNGVKNRGEKPKVLKNVKIFEEAATANWRPTIFSNLVEISDIGLIRTNGGTNRQSYARGTLRNGYLRYRYEGKYYPIHHLVYEAFVGPIPDGMVIDHIDGNKENNRVSNLRCVTQSENMKNAMVLGHKCQKKIQQFDLDGNLIQTWDSIAKAARAMNVTHASIRSAANRNGTSCGFRWKLIED